MHFCVSWKIIDNRLFVRTNKPRCTTTMSSKASRRHSWYGIFSLKSHLSPLKRTASHLIPIRGGHGRSKGHKLFILHTDSSRDLTIALPDEQSPHVDMTIPEQRLKGDLTPQTTNQAREKAKMKLSASSKVEKPKSSKSTKNADNGKNNQEVHRPEEPYERIRAESLAEPGYVSRSRSSSVATDLTVHTLDPYKLRSMEFESSPLARSAMSIHSHVYRPELRSKRRPPPELGETKLEKSEEPKQAVKKAEKDTEESVGVINKPEKVAKESTQNKISKNTDKDDLKITKTNQEVNEEPEEPLNKLDVSLQTTKSHLDHPENIMRPDAAGERSPDRILEEIQYEIDNLHGMAKSGTLDPKGSPVPKQQLSPEQPAKAKAVEEAPQRQTSVASSTSVPDFLGSIDGMSSLDRGLSTDLGSLGEGSKLRSDEESLGEESVDSGEMNRNPSTEVLSTNAKTIATSLTNATPIISNQATTTTSGELLTSTEDKQEETRSNSGKSSASKGNLAFTTANSASEPSVSDDSASPASVSPVRNKNIARLSLQSLTLSHRKIADLQNELPPEVKTEERTESSSSGLHISNPEVKDSPPADSTKDLSMETQQPEKKQTSEASSNASVSPVSPQVFQPSTPAADGILHVSVPSPGYVSSVRKLILPTPTEASDANNTSGEGAEASSITDSVDSGSGSSDVEEASSSHRSRNSSSHSQISFVAAPAYENAPRKMVIVNPSEDSMEQSGKSSDVPLHEPIVSGNEMNRDDFRAVSGNSQLNNPVIAPPRPLSSNCSSLSDGYVSARSGNTPLPNIGANWGGNGDKAEGIAIPKPAAKIQQPSDLPSTGVVTSSDSGIPSSTEGVKAEEKPTNSQGLGQKSLYIERLRGIGLSSYTGQQPSDKVLPIAIRPDRPHHRRTPSHQATIASLQSSLKHGTLRPKTRMLASEIDESELPDSKLSHDLAKTKVPTDPDAEIIAVTNQLKRLTADPAQLTRRESGVNRFSSVRSARGFSLSGKQLKLFIANPDESDEEDVKQE